MGTGEALPFRESSDNGAEWTLNYSNPIVAAFTSEDAKNIESLGEIGKLSGGAAEYALIWRIVKEAHIPLLDLEQNWTFDMMISFNAYLEMGNDYKSAWTEFYSHKEE